MSDDLMSVIKIDPRSLSAFTDHLAFALDNHLRDPERATFPGDGLERLSMLLDTALQRTPFSIASGPTARLVGTQPIQRPATVPVERLTTHLKRLRRLLAASSTLSFARTRLRVVLSAIAADLDNIDSTRLADAKNRQHLAADPV